MIPLLDVDLREALTFLSTLHWGCNLQLGIVDFQFDSKTVVDSLYGGKNGVFNYSAVIDDCRRLLALDLVTFDVRFIMRQANEVAHSFTRTALCHSCFHIHIKIPLCISTIILIEIQ